MLYIVRANLLWSLFYPDISHDTLLSRLLNSCSLTNISSQASSTIRMGRPNTLGNQAHLASCLQELWGIEATTKLKQLTRSLRCTNKHPMWERRGGGPWRNKGKSDKVKCEKGQNQREKVNLFFWNEGKPIRTWFHKTNLQFDSSPCLPSWTDTHTYTPHSPSPIPHTQSPRLGPRESTSFIILPSAPPFSAGGPVPLPKKRPQAYVLCVYIGQRAPALKPSPVLEAHPLLEMENCLETPTRLAALFLNMH